MLPRVKKTEANCYSRHSCSKLLLIDVILICFKLYTEKFREWDLVQQKRFLRKNARRSVSR